MAKAERLKKRRWKLWLSLGGLAALLLVAIAALVTAPIFTSTSIHYGHPDVGLGPTTLEERITAADVIARVKLRSVAKTTEQLGKFGELKDVDALEYTFDALEYLKGSGGSQLKAVATDDDGWYDDLGEEGVILGFESLRHNVDFLEERDTQWDDRDAIVFLQKRGEELPSTEQADRYWLGSLSSIGLIEYTIGSRIDRHWLPDAAAPTPTPAPGGSGASAAPSGGDQRFLRRAGAGLDRRGRPAVPAGGAGDGGWGAGGDDRPVWPQSADRQGGGGGGRGGKLDDGRELRGFEASRGVRVAVPRGGEQHQVHHGGIQRVRALEVRVEENSRHHDGWGQHV